MRKHCYNAITYHNNQVQMYSNKLILNGMVDRKKENSLLELNYPKLQ